MPTSHRIERLPVDQLTARTDLLRAWEACLRRGAPGAVYLHPDLVLSGGPDFEGSQLVTMSGPDGGLEGLAVLAPKRLNTRPLGRHGPKVTLTGYRLVGDQVIAPADPEVLDGFVRSFCEPLAAGAAGLVYFENVEVDSPLWQAVHRVARGQRGLATHYHTRLAQPYYFIHFPDPPADYWKKFSGKTRNTLRRKAGKFEHQLVRYTSPDEVPAFLEKAHQVSQASWQGKRLGVRVENSPKERDEWTRIAKLGGFRSYTLDHAGTPVAFVLGSCYHGCYRYEDVGYHQAHAQHSPGTVLLYRLIEDLVGHAPPHAHVLDFGLGEADYKRAFATDQVLTGPILLVRRSLRSSSVLRAEQATAWLDKQARRAIRRAGLLNFFRRRHRRTGDPRTPEAGPEVAAPDPAVGPGDPGRS
jgi:hypothetical protein